MALNGTRAATGDGFKLKPGSKNKSTGTNFRMDSPLKATGFGNGDNEKDISKKEYDSMMKKYGSKVKRDDKGDIRFGWAGKKLLSEEKRKKIIETDRKYRSKK